MKAVLLIQFTIQDIYRHYSFKIVKTILEEISVEKKVTSEQLTLLKERAKSCPVAQMIKHQTEFRSIMKN